jgi:serine/threonine protein phosphatase PrpC
MKYQVGKTSRLGNRKVNEDHLGVAENSDAVLLVLADGMGGYKGGQVASRVLVKHMLNCFKRSQFPIRNVPNFLKEMIADAHLAIIRAGSQQDPPMEPRTTCVVCLVQGDRAWWAHVGDSRLYLFRMGQPVIRTVDHSRIEELFRKGKIKEKEMKKHPQRNLVTRCVGYQQCPPVATVSDETQLNKSDLIMLCSDGLWGTLSDKVIEKILGDFTITMAVENLASSAETQAYPESDNVSVVAFRWLSSGLGEKDDKSKKATRSGSNVDTAVESVGKMGKAPM